MNGLKGIVMAGGQSARMLTDKALLVYHQSPQYLHLSEMLSRICDEVHLSGKSRTYDGINCIFDQPELGDIGPIAGVITVLERLQSPVICIGVDYPMLTEEDLQHLIQNRNPEKAATVYYDPETGFMEPLLAIYEPRILKVLKEEVGQGRTSLQKILNNSETEKVVPLDKLRIVSADTPEQFEQIRKSHEQR